VLLYHKPEGEIVSRDDPEGRATVFSALPRLRQGRWLSIGRLDYNTSGLLIFTDSGELAHALMHPSAGLEREYAVRVLGELAPGQPERLLRGIDLADGPARFDSISDGGGEGANHWYRVVVREGRNRLVRRLFEACNLTVSRLMRVRFGPVHLPPRLRRGQVMELTPAEVTSLQASVTAHASARVRGAGAARATVTGQADGHRGEGPAPTPSREASPPPSQAPREATVPEGAAAAGAPVSGTRRRLSLPPGRSRASTAAMDESGAKSRRAPLRPAGRMRGASTPSRGAGGTRRGDAASPLSGRDASGVPMPGRSRPGGRPAGPRGESRTPKKSPRSSRPR